MSYISHEKTAKGLRNRLIHLRNLRKSLLKDKDNKLIVEVKKEYTQILDIFIHHAFIHLKNRYKSHIK